jgi:hypothetical protein
MVRFFSLGPNYHARSKSVSTYIARNVDGFLSGARIGRDKLLLALGFPNTKP